MERIQKIRDGFPKIYDASYDDDGQSYGRKRVNAQVRLLMKDGVRIPYSADWEEVQALFDERAARDEITEHGKILRIKRRSRLHRFG